MLCLVFLCTGALVLINSMGSLLGDNNINIKLAHTKTTRERKSIKAPLIKINQLKYL